MDFDRIKEVKNRVNLIDVLKDAGICLKSNNMACCPFHNENTPSFSVKGERYKCFSCGEGGDVIDFVSKYYNISPVEAAKRLDDTYNLGVFRELTADEKKEIARQNIEKEKEKAYRAEFKAIRDRLYAKKCKAYREWRLIMELSDPSKFGINSFYVKAYNEAQKIEHWFEQEADLWRI